MEISISKVLFLMPPFRFRSKVSPTCFFTFENSLVIINCFILVSYSHPENLPIYEHEIYVFWGVTPYILVNKYQYFWGTSCLLFYFTNVTPWRWRQMFSESLIPTHQAVSSTSQNSADLVWYSHYRILCCSVLVIMKSSIFVLGSYGA